MNSIIKEYSSQPILFDYLDDEKGDHATDNSESSLWDLEEPNEKQGNTEGLCQDSEASLWNEYIFNDTYNAIYDILSYYCEKHDDPKWPSYKKRVLDELSCFAVDRDVERLCFSIDYRQGDELRYFKATPHNSWHASCLHNVPSYCPKILANTGSIPRDFQII